ncbi:MAG: hypothetical protein M3394_07965, partial [Actinomycetota bacterium]|nr:hypothetical protein [Actinomycetota bacterium]
MDAPARPVARLTPEQQRVARFAATAAALVFVGLWAPAYPRPGALALSGIGIVMAALLFLAARRGSVVLTALAAFLVSFGPWGALWVLGAPYIAWSGMLLFRASKAAAEVAGPREPRRKQKAAPAPAVEAPVDRRAPDRSK